ncbi:MAG: hypothetical protein JWM89_2542 [Acidimicrobiales bacterium]|nr:hypothetical protein [Acidimicrobiales bacterium]
MGTNGRQTPGETGSEPGGATEPITLTDPDGAVTRVAPWSSWTREQVRAPGGEPALVTRLDQGQLWFAAGRRRSPWHHEVHVGPAVVSTPRGRFHATAEPDGGATIVCLAGRTRVVAGLREPVLLGPDQSAAVSADGRTLVVTDGPATANGLGGSTADPDIDLRDPVEGPGHRPALTPGDGSPIQVAPAAPASKPVVRKPRPSPRPVASDDDVASRRSRWGWLPEVAAVAALVALLIAAVVVFGKPKDEPSSLASPSPTTTPITRPLTSTTLAPTTTSPPTTTAPATTAPPTTATTPSVPTTGVARPPAVASGATAIGELSSCKRAPGGVVATVHVTQRTGPAARFQVTVGLIDAHDQVFAQGRATSAQVAPKGQADVAVKVALAGTARGSCELLGVTPV